MKRFSCGQHVVEWVADRTNDFGNFGAAHGIGLQVPGWPTHFGTSWKLVAGVVYEQYNGPNIVCHIAAEGKTWANRAYLRAIFEYPFVVLKCKRITVCVGEGNAASRKFVEHLGFELETKLKEAHPTGDLLIYRMREPRCRYLREPYAKSGTVLLRAA